MEQQSSIATLPIKKKGWDVDIVLAFGTLFLIIYNIAALVLLGFGELPIVGWLLIPLPFFSLAILVFTPASVVYLLYSCFRYRKKLSAKQVYFRLILIFILPIIPIFHYISPGFLLNYTVTDTVMRWNVNRNGGMDQLQAWAVEILQKPEIKKSARHTDIDSNMKSDQVHQLKGDVFVRPEFSETLSHVDITYGGGFHHWGIVIGPRTFTPQKDEHYHYIYWQDGIYGYHER